MKTPVHIPQKVKCIFFDVADTLLCKPLLIQTIQQCLVKNGLFASPEQIRKTLFDLSDNLNVPDKTSKDFYLDFNSKLLLELNLEATPQCAEEIYNACRGLAWRAYSDTIILEDLHNRYTLGIVSNWDNSLREKLSVFFPAVFDIHFVSAEIKLKKPDEAIYRYAVEKSGLSAAEILYIGNSVILDYLPAEKAGLNTILIDRHEQYPQFFGNKITSLLQLTLPSNEPPDPLFKMDRSESSGPN